MCLHSASLIGSLSLIQYLIQKGANIEAKGNNQKNSSTFCYQNGSIPFVQYHIEKGANIETKDTRKQTSLHHASEHG